MSEEKRPKVGIGVIILKEKKVLLGKRRNSHGAGTWSFPGGNLEYFESFRRCGLREILEETGLDVRLIDEDSIATTNDLFEEGEHYITLFLRAAHLQGEPRVMEPDKCERWGWYSWNKFPKPLFLPVQNLLKQEYNPFEI